MLFGSQKGFTLVELLVVLAIIGMLSSTVMASLGSARMKARNAKRLATMNQYELVLESILNDTYGYPTTGAVNTVYCLGDYPDNACWTGGGGYPESATLNTALLKYINPLPTWEGSVAGTEGGVYNCQAVSGTRCTKISIDWMMEGENTSCGKGKDVTSSYPTEVGKGITHCNYSRTI